MGLGLLARWPEIQRKVASAETRLRIEAVEHRGTRTLQVEGRHLTSRYRRDEEAETQASRIPADAKDVAVYGLALGDLCRHLLDRPIETLRVIILQRELAARALEDFDFEWLSDPRVDVVLGRDARMLEPHWAASPVSLAFADADALPIRDRVLLEVGRPYQERRHAEREAMIQATFEHNDALRRSDGDVAELFRTRSGSIAVAAAGPTLSDSFEWLRDSRPWVISVTTAVGPLQKAGIDPDLVIAVDPKPELVTHYPAMDLLRLRETPLVYAACVHRSFLEKWPGPRLGAYLGQPRYERLAEARPRGTLFCSGTVTHAATDLAVQMGAERVWLLGADFAYLRTRSHVEGAPNERGLPTDAVFDVLTGRGDRAPSDLALIGFLRDLEGYIALHPEVEFLCRSLDGAKIARTKFKNARDDV
ncbi:MAG: 6-hydroxymethylpterin diphosphokinase MptE-like protein [Myxococcota bacterium]